MGQESKGGQGRPDTGNSGSQGQERRVGRELQALWSPMDTEAKEVDGASLWASRIFRASVNMIRSVL